MPDTKPGEPFEDIHESRIMYKKSGSFATDDPLVCFLYQLMRDIVPPGEVEEIMRQLAETTDNVTHLSNGWLAQHAQDVATRLRKLA